MQVHLYKCAAILSVLGTSAEIPLYAEPEQPTEAAAAAGAVPHPGPSAPVWWPQVNQDSRQCQEGWKDEVSNFSQDTLP